MSGDGGYAIWQAAHKGDRTGLTRLVELGMDVNARDEVSTTHNALQPCGGACGPCPLAVPWYPSPALTHGVELTAYRKGTRQSSWRRRVAPHARSDFLLTTLTSGLLEGSSGSPGSCSSSRAHLLRTNGTGPLSVPVWVCEAVADFRSAHNTQAATQTA